MEQQETTSYSAFVGIDISAKTADITFLTDVNNKHKHWKIKQTPGEYKKLCDRLNRYHPESSEVLVVMESTGAYWRNLADYLHTTGGYAVCVLNPYRAFYFARAMMKRDKSDKIDSLLLAQMGYLTHSLLPLWTPPPPMSKKLYQLLQQRDKLTHISVQQTNRRHAFDYHTDDPLPEVIERDDILRTLIDKQRRRIRKEIMLLMKEDEAYNRTFQHLMSVDGVGVITAGYLIYVTENFSPTLFSEPKHLASLIGLVPRTYESGTSVHKSAKIGHSGRPHLRELLYLAAMSATQSKYAGSNLYNYYHRLLRKGKTKKQAFIAVAHKLLYICWAVATKQEDYVSDYKKAS